MFCTNCGNQVPDGTAVCPNCGNNLAASAMGNPYQMPKKSFDVAKMLAFFNKKGDKVNVIGLIIALVTFLTTLLPMIKIDKLRNMWSLTANANAFDFYFPIIFIPLFVLIFVSYFKKQDNMATIYASVNALFSIIFFIITLVNAKTKFPYGTRVNYKVAFGIIIYFIFVILYTAFAWLWPIIQKSMANSQAQKAMYMQQQQQFYAQQQQMMQQQMAQQQIAPQQMAPQQMAPQQPVQPQQPQQPMQ